MQCLSWNVYSVEYLMNELKYILHSTIQWLGWNMYCVGIGNDWFETCIAFEYAMICIVFEYAMIELKYVLRWNMQWLSWNM